MDECKEICQRQTEMEKARHPMFQQELEELRSKVRSFPIGSDVFICRRQHGKHRRRVSCQEAAADCSGTLGRVTDAVDEPVAAVGSLLRAGDERCLVPILAARLLPHLSTQDGRRAHAAV